MTDNLTQTCWRGMAVTHPEAWELAVFSGRDEPGRCTFNDRIYQRLDVRWRDLTYVPNLDLILDRYRRRSEKEKSQPVLPLPDPPEHWQGVMRPTKNGMVIYAARYYRQPRWLAEVTLIWPDRRDEHLERQILDSIQPQDPDTPLRHWQALGIDMDISRPFDLTDCSAKVGRVAWTFTVPNARKEHAHLKHSSLLVERLAMPAAWIKGSMQDWLKDQIPSQRKVVSEELAIFNTHRCQRLTSTASAGTFSTLRGVRSVWMDVAWQCPTEGRLYHLRMCERSGDESIGFPDNLAVRCCRQPPQPRLSSP